jgi:flagellar hook-basal body complex protein FliE
MSIVPIDFIAPGATLEQVMLSSAGGGVDKASATTDFSTWMDGYVGSLNQKLLEADQLSARLVAGDIDNLHQIMIGLEESKLAFQLAVQVRNRILDAYQEISRIQL